MSYIDKIRVDGSLYSVQDDRLPDPEVADEGKFIKVDASGNYELGEVEMIDAYTKTETNELLAEKQDTLVSNSNIKTINNQSVLGSGNIQIDGVTNYDDLSNKPVINQLHLNLG